MTESSYSCPGKVKCFECSRASSTWKIDSTNHIKSYQLLVFAFSSLPWLMIGCSCHRLEGTPPAPFMAFVESTGFEVKSVSLSSIEPGWDSTDVLVNWCSRVPSSYLVLASSSSSLFSSCLNSSTMSSSFSSLSFFFSSPEPPASSGPDSSVLLSGLLSSESSTSASSPSVPAGISAWLWSSNKRNVACELS